MCVCVCACALQVSATFICSSLKGQYSEEMAIITSDHSKTMCNQIFIMISLNNKMTGDASDWLCEN